MVRCPLQNPIKERLIFALSILMPSTSLPYKPLSNLFLSKR